MSAPPRPIYVGSGSPAPAGGISVLLRDPQSGAIRHAGVVAEVAEVRYLAWHPAVPVVYCANGTGVTAFARSGDDGLLPLAHADFEGGAPCHLSVHPNGGHLMSADYAAGTLSVHEVRSDGTIGMRTHLEQLSGSGPDPRRQEASHPHQIITAPGARHVLATDLGADAVYVYALDAETGRLVEVFRAALHPGTGPRHLAFASPSLLYVVGELDPTVTALRYSTETGELREVSRAASVEIVGSGNRAYPSTVVIAPGGRFLYIGNRGSDSLGVMAADAGRLGAVREVPSGGQWPADLMLAGSMLYVANTRSDEVCAFRVDASTGRLEPSGEPVAVSAPSCLA